jgi:hypothetical protein
MNHSLLEPALFDQLPHRPSHHTFANALFSHYTHRAANRPSRQYGSGKKIFRADFYQTQNPS